MPEEITHASQAGHAISVIRFGPYEVDLRSAELRKNDVKIRLQEQPFQILIALLDRPGEIVLREEIRQKLWPDGTVVGFDHSINAAVKRLRDALCETAEKPRYIETLARRGYRFVAPVSLGVDQASQPESVAVLAAASQPAPPPDLRPASLALAGRGPRRIVILAAAAGGLTLFVSAFLFLRTGAVPPADLHVVPLTSNTGVEIQPSISPDGTRVAYTWSLSPQKQPAIYMKLIGPGEAVRMSRDLPRVFSPAWSPDGLWIAALQDLGQMGDVILIPASGGQHRVLARLRKGDPGADACAFGTSSYICGLPSFPGSVLAWSRNGKYLFTSAVVVAGSRSAIVRLSVETGEVQFVTNPARESAGDFGPAVSPDGTHLAFARFRSARTGDLYTISLTEQESSNARQDPVRVTTDGADILTPAWTHDSRTLVFSSNRAGRRELWRVLASGGTPARVLGVGEEALDVALSQNRLVYNHGHYSGSLWKIPISQGKGGEPVRVTASTTRDKYPQFSPDGKRITFESGRSGVDEIWVCDADGTNAIQLTSFASGISGTPRWSPDGRMIAFDSNVSGSFDIYVVSSDGGRALQLTNDSSTDAIPSWSRDGAWIYFTSSRSGGSEVWKVRANGGPETQVTSEGGTLAAESVDGSDLYFVRGNEKLGDLFRMPKDGGKVTKILSGIKGRLFTVFDKGIYFAAGFPRTELRYLDFDTSTIRVVSPLPGVPYADVSADEHWALYPQEAMSDTNLMVVENFR